jgi:hypothetical protein
LSTTESTAFTGCVLGTEGMARFPFGRQRHATSGRNQRGFVCKKKKLRTKSGAFVPKGSWTKKLVVGALPITLDLDAGRRIRIGADHPAFRRYHGGARRSLRRSGLALCGRCFASTGVGTSAAISTTDIRTFRFEFIINLTWLHHPCDPNSAYAVAHKPPSHYCVEKYMSCKDLMQTRRVGCAHFGEG